MAGYVAQSDIKPINGKQWVLDHWDQYNLVDSKQKMLELLNILQACDETLDSLHDVLINGESEFCDFFTDNLNTDREIVDALFYFCSFYTEKEFIDLMIEKHQDEIKWNGMEEATESIRSDTSDDPKDNNDCQISKTEDGYVIRIWC